MYLDSILNTLRPIGEITTTPMFGGFGLFKDKIMFALVHQEHIYFRFDDASQHTFEPEALIRFTYKKSGSITNTQYFTHESFKSNIALVLKHAQNALIRAEQRKQSSRVSFNEQRIKDLPNMTYNMEIMLKKSGVDSVTALKRLGALQSFVRLKKRFPEIGDKAVLSIQGAISGQHSAVLAKSERSKLLRLVKAI